MMKLKILWYFIRHPGLKVHGTMFERPARVRDVFVEDDKIVLHVY